jgi:hypothetical protein
MRKSLNPNIPVKIIPFVVLLAFSLCAAFLDTAGAQPLTVTTIAGKFDHNGYINGVGTNAQFHGLNDFSDLAADANGFLYVVDGNSIRRISPDLLVVTLAGNPVQAGYVDATGTNALFSSPAGIAADANGNVYVADQGNYVIRKISFAGVVSTVAGDGTYGYVDSDAGTPEFQGPNSVALDSAGNIYVADYTTLRKITSAGVVSTLAGTQSPGFNDGTGTNARFIYPFFLAANADGNIYVAMAWFIRQVTPDGTVSTLAGSDHTDHDGIGTSAGFDGAYSIAVDKAGGLYVADFNVGTIRYVTSAGVATTVAGTINRFPYPGSNDGVGTNAWMEGPQGIAVDPFGNVYIVDGGEYTVLKGVPPSLSPIGSFSESPGGTPVRSSNPWQFTAYFTNIVSDLRLRVQSTTTTNDEASWMDLPDGGQMIDVDGNWTLNTTDVPTGTRYFRVIASAPGYADSASAAVGPENVQAGIAPFGFFKWETTYPNQTGNVWVFNIDESSIISGLSLRVQSTDDGGTNWNDLPSGQMTRFGSTWALNTTNLPTGNVSFRVIASAPNYIDRDSASLGPFTIQPPLPTVVESSSTGGTYTLDSIMGPTPEQIYFNAVSNAVVKFGCTDTTNYNSAVNLAGQQYAAAVLQIEASQNVPILAANMGQNSTLILKGAITGNVSLDSQDASGVISPNGGNVISPNGGNLTHDAGTDALISQDGGGLISQDGGGLISQDGGGLISQDGGGVISPNGGNLTGQVVSSGTSPVSTPKKNGPIKPLVDPLQPTFTGLMTINGNYSQFPGTMLMIGIAGTNTLSEGAQQFDQLVVNGEANLIGGTIAFELFDPNDQTDRTNVFQPPDGATFDVVVASNIVANAVHIRGPVWADGLFFSGSVVTRTDGLQAVRLMATHIPPQIFLQNSGSALRLVYGTNYTGYTVQSTPSLSSTNWTTFSTGTNAVMLSPTNSSRFFRLSKP